MSTTFISAGYKEEISIILLVNQKKIIQYLLFQWLSLGGWHFDFFICLIKKPSPPKIRKNLVCLSSRADLPCLFHSIYPRTIMFYKVRYYIYLPYFEYIFFSDAELTYGSLSVDSTEQEKIIASLSLDNFQQKNLYQHWNLRNLFFYKNVHVSKS